MKNILKLLLITIPMFFNAYVNAAEKETLNATYTYSQNILLKNWALSICLAAIAVNEQAREDDLT